MFRECEGLVLGISVWFSLSQWTLLKKTSAELLLSQRSPEDLNVLPWSVEIVIGTHHLYCERFYDFFVSVKAIRKCFVRIMHFHLELTRSLSFAFI